jgi:hypothetical protein
MQFQRLVISNTKGRPPRGGISSWGSEVFFHGFLRQSKLSGLFKQPIISKWLLQKTPKKITPDENSATPFNGVTTPKCRYRTP